jgi:hypothetical protein
MHKRSVVGSAQYVRLTDDRRLHNDHIVYIADRRGYQ